jgi:pleuromutilin/lincosamide/streptogramin A transport system ATP-binding/permease protein
MENIATRLLILENSTLTSFDGSYQQFKNDTPQEAADTKEQELLVIETRITEVLSKLSLEPSEALDEEFQELLRKKRELLDN